MMARKKVIGILRKLNYRDMFSRLISLIGAGSLDGKNKTFLQCNIELFLICLRKPSLHLIIPRVIFFLFCHIQNIYKFDYSKIDRRLLYIVHVMSVPTGPFRYDAFMCACSVVSSVSFLDDKIILLQENYLRNAHTTQDVKM